METKKSYKQQREKNGASFHSLKPPGLVITYERYYAEILQYDKKFWRKS